MNRWHSLSSSLDFSQSLQIILKDVYLFRNALSLSENIVEIELLEILLFLLQVGTVLINILVYYLSRFVLNHILQLFLKATNTLHNSSEEFRIFIVASSLPINLICTDFFLYLLYSFFKLQKFTRNR